MFPTRDRQLRLARSRGIYNPEMTTMVACGFEFPELDSRGRDGVKFEEDSKLVSKSPRENFGSIVDEISIFVESFSLLIFSLGKKKEKISCK